MENERRNSKLDVEHYDLEILLRRPSLRTGLPRRVSQIRKDTVPTHETTCGFWCLRDDWLQSFANRTTYLFVYGVLGSFYGAYYAYFCGILTTLEKTFRLSSQTISLIAAVSDIVLLVMCFILSFVTPKSHKTKWAGLGILIIIISTIVTSLPHFLYGTGKVTEEEKDKNLTFKNVFYRSENVCSETSQTCINNENEKNMSIILLTVAQILHGLGGSLYIILGKSYRDDNLQKYRPPAVISLLVMLNALGPAFGFWLASVCLKIFGTPSNIPYTSENDPYWIGAWWLGNLLIGFLLLIPATFIILFPSILPKTAVRRIFNVKKTTEVTIPLEDKTTEITNLALNPTFNKYNFAGIFNIAGFFGYFIFIPKYVEIQFQLLPSEANFITGTMALICCAVGILFGNYIVTRYRPTVKALAGWNVFVGILSVCALTALIYLVCVNQDTQIQQLVTQISQLPGNTTTRFAPICNGLGETKATPCDCARVVYKNNTKVYEECDFKSNQKEGYPGVCPVDCHFSFLIFMIIICTMSFLYASGRSSSFWYEMKYNKIKKSYRFILGKTFFSFLAFIPAPILFGYILDGNCLVWDTTCSHRGNCWLYDNERMRYSINLTAIGFAVVGIVFDTMFLYFVKNLQLFTQGDQYIDEYDENYL